MRRRALAALVSREWRTAWTDRGAYVLRALYAAALLVGVVAMAVALPISHPGRLEELPDYLRGLFAWFCRAQFVIATVLASLTFARAVCREQERGTLDLLILTPLSGMEILLGKLSGEFLGLAALLAAGLPMFFLLLPLGGVSPIEILSVHALLLAHLLVVGGLCVGFAAALGRTLPVMLCTCGAVLLWNGGPALGRIWGHGRGWGWLWDAWQSHSTRGWLDRQLASVGLVPALAGEAAAFGLLAALLFSGLGSLVLERRVTRGPGRGFWRTLAAAFRKAAASRRAGFLFRPFLRIEHPLLRRECGVERDLPFRAAWLGFFAVYALSVAAVLGGPENHVLAHLALGGFGWMAASLIAILLGASSIGADRRRGALEALLAAGVAPEDLVKACLAGSLLRAGYLLAPPVLHLAVVGLVAGELGAAEFAWRLPASLAAVFLGTLAMMGITLFISLRVRRAEVASVLAAFWALPIGLAIMAMVGGSILSLVMGLPIIVLGMLVFYAELARSVPKRVLR